MDRQDAVTKKSTGMQETAIRPCELRMERRTRDADGKERIEFVCGASGGPEAGYVLGVAGEDCAAMAAICNACSNRRIFRTRRSLVALQPVNAKLAKRNLRLCR